MTVTAIYENGVLRPQEPLDLEEGAVVTVTLEESNNGAAFAEVPPELQAEFEMWDRASDEDFLAFEEMLRRENESD